MSEIDLDMLLDDLESENIIEDQNENSNSESLISEPNSPSEQVTSAQLVKMLESVWLNEKFAPELLPNKFGVIEAVLGQISYMEQNLESLESNDFKKSLHQMEVDRLRYLASSYLRYRLEKIETYTTHILKAEEERLNKNEKAYLTEEEMQFAKEFNSALENHFGKVLEFWKFSSKSDWKKHPVSPNMYSFIFLKSKDDIPGIVLDDGRNDDGDVVDFKNESQVLISYHTVSNLVKNGKVQLI